MAYLSAVVLSAVVCLAMADDAKPEAAVDSAENGKFCKSVVHQNVDLTKLKGIWWEAESYNTDSFVEKEDKCHVSYFYPEGDKKIKVSNDYVSKQSNAHKKYSYTILDKEDPKDGNLVALMQIFLPFGGKKEVEYDVLATDHVNYLVVQICYDGPGTKDDFKAGLVLTKTKETDLKNDAFKTAIDAAFKNNNVDRSKNEVNDLTKCDAIEFPATFTETETSS